MIFLRLGLSSFGGPIAHLSYFRAEFVQKRKWLSEHSYAELVSLCQFLPGPASSQVGIAIGYSRGRILGGVLAWVGFTLPSAVLLTMFGLGLGPLIHAAGTGWIAGVKIVAVAVVAQALWGMGKNLCPDKISASLAISAMATSLLVPSPFTQIAIILGSGFLANIFPQRRTNVSHEALKIDANPRWALFLLSLWIAMLFVLPVISSWTGNGALSIFDKYFRVGSLVFGGGHVVLPLLESEIVGAGWVSNDTFFAGYGMAQAVPGPLFSVAGYLGAVSQYSPSSWVGAVIALGGIFLPSFLILLGVLPLWGHLRRYSALQTALQGMNAAVVGLLLAAFYQSAWVSAIHNSRDFVFAATAFLLLQFWQVPSWLAVLLGASCGYCLGYFEIR